MRIRNNLVSLEDAKSALKRKISIMEKYETKISRICVLNQCCIDVRGKRFSQLEDEIMTICCNEEKCKDILKLFWKSLKTYQHEFSQALNYNRSILGQFIYPSVTYAKAEHDSIVKVDLTFAYMGSLSSSDCRLPFGSKQVNL